MFKILKNKINNMEKILNLFYPYYEFPFQWNMIIKYNIKQIKLIYEYNTNLKKDEFLIIVMLDNDEFKFVYKSLFLNNLLNENVSILIYTYLNENQNGFLIDTYFKNKLYFFKLISYFNFKDEIINIFTNVLDESFIYLKRKYHIDETDNIRSWIDSGLVDKNEFYNK